MPRATLPPNQLPEPSPPPRRREPSEPFPFDVVRDLLGICRAIALATPIENRARRARLREVGDALVRALELAHRHIDAPEGWGAFAARTLARDATKRLGDEIGALMPAPPVLLAAETRAGWGRAVREPSAPGRTHARPRARAS